MQFWLEKWERLISRHTTPPVLQRRGLNPIWTEHEGHDCYKLHKKRWEETTRREGNEKSKFHFTEAIVRWQLLRCRTVEDEHHCLAGARGHRPPDRQLLLMPSRYPESSRSLPTFCSVWTCLPRLQTQLLGHWSRTKSLRQFGRSRRRLAQSGVLEIMSLYAAFAYNIRMLQIQFSKACQLKWCIMGGKRAAKKLLWQKLDRMTTKDIGKSPIKPQMLPSTYNALVITQNTLATS